MVVDGKLAIERSQSHDYDLILMDIQMPVMDGITACKAIRSNHDHPHSAKPIIGLTAHSMPEEHQRCVWIQA